MVFFLLCFPFPLATPEKCHLCFVKKRVGAGFLKPFKNSDVSPVSGYQILHVLFLIRLFPHGILMDSPVRRINIRTAYRKIAFLIDTQHLIKKIILFYFNIVV